MVAATSERAAYLTHPNGRYRWDRKRAGWYLPNAASDARSPDDTWDVPDAIVVTLIGTAKRGTKAGVICASFNAG